MKVQVEEEICINCGLCYEGYPELFKEGFNTSTLKRAQVPRKLERECQEVADSCPCGAIKVKE